MGAFHSGTDDTHVDRNFPVSITIAFGKEGGGLVYDAVSHQTTQCGKETSSKGTVKYVAPTPTFDTEAFIKEAEKNVDKGKQPLYRQSHLKPPDYSIYQGAAGGFPLGGYSDRYFINKDGNVMTKKQYRKHMRELWEQDD